MHSSLQCTQSGGVESEAQVPRIGYKHNSEVYENLTNALMSWTVKTLLFMAKHMSDEYELSMVFDHTIGLLVGPRTQFALWSRQLAPLMSTTACPLLFSKSV